MICLDWQPNHVVDQCQLSQKYPLLACSSLLAGPPVTLILLSIRSPQLLIMQSTPDLIEKQSLIDCGIPGTNAILASPSWKQASMNGCPKDFKDSWGLLYIRKGNNQACAVHQSDSRNNNSTQQQQFHCTHSPFIIKKLLLTRSAKSGEE
jgi:hypothetical protein